jgi:DNA polymerase III delta prime subunit
MTVDMKADELIWAQKYRPKKIEDTILPKKMKDIFQKFVDNNNIPNLLLAGSHGMGKTTAAIAMLEETGCDYIKINGSLNGGIDTLRNEIANFASSVSFTGNRKYVIIDEADYLTAATQSALRSFIEEFSKNCGFIFTCNYKQRIIEPLRESRFTTVDYIIEPSEKPKLALQFFKRVLSILDQENVEYDKKAVASLVDNFFPDFRKTLNELQKYASLGKIDETVLTVSHSMSLDDLFGMLKNKKFTDMRKWISQNSDMDYNDFFRDMYILSNEKVELKSMPGYIILLAKYQYQHALVADPEINIAAMLSEIMLEVSFL